jgi:archaeosine synthase beta-subunit
VAMGLESAHPGVLDRLNKGLTLDEFAAASVALRERGVALRVFLLVAPPFLEHLIGPTRPDESQDAWLLRSIDTAFACGATVVSLIPTRSGNGAMEALEAAGLFRPPTLSDIERGAALALDHASHRGRIFMDIWDVDRFAGCRDCLAARRARLVRMNLEQRVLPLLACPSCQ